MSESASSDILHVLMRSKEIHLYNYKQANAYSRKVDFLSVLDLPEGSVDFGKNIPEHDVNLVGPMVELVTTKALHPALSDLILEAATEVHGKPGSIPTTRRISESDRTRHPRERRRRSIL